MPYSFNPFSGNFDNTPSTLKGDTAYSNLLSNSANWVDAYDTGTVYKANSASYATVDFTNSKFFPLTGGQIIGNTRINGNVTIFGDLTSNGTQTFTNTIFSTTSALSVVHVGSGPAVWVGNNGSGDIASFYDIDQGVEVLHVGGENGDFPNVGVKTSSPNKDFTIKGELSASSDIWTSGRIISGGQELASIFRPDIDRGLSVFNTVQSNSAINWNYQGTDLKGLSANWQNTYTNFSSNSASYTTQSFVNSKFYPLTGGTISGSVSTTGSGSFGNLFVSEQAPGDAVLYASDYKVGINTEAPNEALTVFGNISATGTIYGNGSGLSNTDNRNVNSWVFANSANAFFNSVSAISLSGIFYGDGSNLIGASLPGQEAINTLVQTNSAAWSAAVIYIKKFDYVADGIDYSYSGLASEGTLDSDSLWKITRLVFSDIGAISASGVAQNVTWNERLTATYI